MNWKGFVTGLGVLGIAFGWIGCATPENTSPVICQSDVIRAGDTVTVSFLDIPQAEPEKEKEFQIRGDGTINMPQIGPVKAVGKKFGELEAELQKVYVPRFYNRLTLIIKPKERFYSVGGQVKQPGRQVYLGETTVIRAIISAGDFNEFANPKKVEIVRATGEREIVNCNKAREHPKLDRPICPGDSIYVPRSF
jgi:polysaccharide biosynthesis/export protein